MKQPAIHIIQNLTGLTDNEIKQLTFEVGCDFLEHMQEEPKMHDQIIRSKIFWTWWNKNIERLTAEFLKIRKKVGHQYEREKTKNMYYFFVRTTQVSDYGLASYCYLVEEVLEREFRKKDKAKVDDLVTV